MSNKAIIYVHGKGGCPKEADHLRPLFPGCETYGIDYKNNTPWEAGKEIGEAILSLSLRSDGIILIANSIGAYFSMNAGIDEYVEKAFFISPIVDMVKLIRDMMNYARVSENELKKRGKIRTDLGEDLSWEYYTFAKDHPVWWKAPTEVLYGSEDTITDRETIKEFCSKHDAGLTVMEGGEHWFHTDEQMDFLINWIKKGTDK